MVYVLNSAYMVLPGITSWQSAITDVATGNARVFEGDETRRIRTPGGLDYPMPISIITNEFKFVETPKSAGTKFAQKTNVSTEDILRRDRRICAYCGGKATTKDHIYPESLGGRETWDNLVAACKPCNRDKKNMLYEEFVAKTGKKLQFQPRVPVPHADREAYQARVWKLLESGLVLV